MVSGRSSATHRDPRAARFQNRHRTRLPFALASSPTATTPDFPPNLPIPTSTPESPLVLFLAPSAPSSPDSESSESGGVGSPPRLTHRTPPPMLFSASRASGLPRRHAVGGVRGGLDAAEEGGLESEAETYPDVDVLELEYPLRGKGSGSDALTTTAGTAGVSAASSTTSAAPVSSARGVVRGSACVYPGPYPGASAEGEKGSEGASSVPQRTSSRRDAAAGQVL